MKAAAARRSRIMDLVLLGQTDAEALSATLDVSLSTIRRDLARLSADGRLLRTYGGAAPVSTLLPEQPLSQRTATNRLQKRAIAAEAAALVQAGETVILDAGTTTGALAALLATRDRSRVVTNGLTAIQELAGAADVELICVGGQLRQVSLGFVGPHAERAMRRISASKVFLGADGVVAGRGICEATDAQASLKELMVRQAEQVFVLADAEKLGRAASAAWTPLDRPWTLITDAGASEAQLQPFRQLGYVTVVIARPRPSPNAAVSEREGVRRPRGSALKAAGSVTLAGRRLLQRPVVVRPVGHLVARPPDLVAARLIGLAGHRLSTERGSGPICPIL